VRALFCGMLLLPVVYGQQRLRPSDLVAQAETLARSGDRQGALDSLAKADQITPQTAATQDKIGFLYAALGQTPEAAKHFQQACRNG